MHRDPHPGETTRGHPEDVVLNPARLAVFCCVVEHGNFTRAADELCLTQPTVSGHIQALEQAFGTTLFDRRRRGAQLTEAGRAVYDLAVTVRRELAAVRAHLSDLAAGEGGAVTLGAGLVPSTYILPGLLAHFHHQHPAAVVRLRVLAPNAVGDEVLQGHIDLGIVSEMSSIPPSLRAEPLWAETLVLVAPPDHPLARQPRIVTADLAGEAFIAGPAVSKGAQALDTALMRAGLPRRRIVMELGTQDGVKRAVLGGVGLAMLFQRVAAPELAAGQLVALPLADLSVAEQFFLIYRRTHRFSPLAQSLIAFIRAQSKVISARPLARLAGRQPVPRAIEEKRTIKARSAASAEMAPSDLTDEQWAVLKPVLSPQGRRGRPRTNDRRMLNGILWVLTTGARWTMLPRRYGTPSACRRRFEAWQAQGVWQCIREAWLSTLEERARSEWQTASAQESVGAPSERARRFD
jgi:DNA-binding transcriptional LysR family regulator